MAVDYTKVFTVIGSHLDKINDYKSYIATYTSDQAAIEGVLAAQTLVRLEGDLVETYDSFKQDTSNHLSDLISRITIVLTDEALIGANFSFGTSPNLQIVWPALIHDMAGNDKNVAANTATVGSVVYDTTNAEIGVIEAGVILDGITPPIDGAQAIRDYAGLTSQLTPTSETLTFTCITDSETGAIRGSEVFTITGTSGQSDGYSATGENIGQLGSLQVCDNLTGQYVSNYSFDSWTGGIPDGWTEAEGTAGVDYEESAEHLFLDDFNTVPGASLKTIQANNDLQLTQALANSSFVRGKSYFLGVWAAKDTDIAADQEMLLQVDDGIFSTVATLSFTPTTTTWTHFQTQFIVPYEIKDALTLKLFSVDGLDNTNDPIYIDQIAITPCEYHAGVAVAIFGGPEKFLIGDTISIPLSNSDAGKFQTLMRKAYKVQLPTDATPTIPDSLVT